ncbi:MAG: hypothetical protein Q9184_003705 [Pyrenodesmia sp. 2 TL-2023]
MSTLRQTRLPQAQADYDKKQKQIKSATDKARHEQLWKFLQPSFAEMTRRGGTFDYPDWEETVKSRAKQTEYMEAQLARGKDELTIKQDKFAMLEVDKKEFLAAAREYALLNEKWEIKEEDALKEGARQLKQALVERPHMAASVINDPEIHQRVEDALKELKVERKDAFEYIKTIGEAMYNRAKRDIAEMGLLQRFEEHVKGVDLLLGGADLARNEAEEALEKSQQELAEAQVALSEHVEDSSAKYSELQQEKERQDGELQEARQQLQELQGQQGSANAELGTQRAEIAGLKQTLQEAVDRYQTCETNSTNLRSERDALQIECEAATSDRDRVQSELDGETEKVQELTTNLSTSNKKLRDVQAELLTANRELEQSATTANDLDRDLKESNTKLAKLEADLQESVTKAQNLDRDLKESNTKLEQSKADLNKDLEKSKQRHLDYLTSVRKDHHESMRKLREKHATELNSEREEAAKELLDLQIRYDLLSIKAAGSDGFDATNKVTALERQLEQSMREKTESQQQLEMTRRLLGHFNQGLPEAMSKIRIQPMVDVNFENDLPCMRFERETAGLDPLLHAMNFWIDARENRPSFSNTQQLFNTRVVNAETVAAYPWIVAALGANLNSMTEWGSDQLAFNRTLTVLQGIAYLKMIATESQISLEDVRRLLRQAGNYLNRESDPETENATEPIIMMVLNKVTSFVDGEQLTTWIYSDETSVKEVRYLDGSNSALEAEQCLIANITGESFVFIDGRNVNETLYGFAETDVEKLYPHAETLQYQLQLKEGFVAECVGRQLPLGRTPAVYDLIGSCLIHKMVAKP